MLKQRQAVRAIVLTPEREVLLLNFRRSDGTSVWITPGGGLEPGETPHEALRRELREEVGIEDVAIGPLIARRRFVFGWGDRQVQQEDALYVVEHPRFEPFMSDPVEAKVIVGFRWWPLEELLSTTEIVGPRTLATVVQRYVSEGAPQGEIPLELTVD